MKDQEFIPKVKRKRATKYEPWMCDKLVEIAEQGGHVAEMCKAIGIRSKDTFYRWITEHKEFGKAYEESKLASQAFYENVLLAGALGKIKNYNFNSIAMILNNKFGGEYKRGTNGNNTEINIGSINSIEKMAPDELEDKIEQLNKKLGYLEYVQEGKPEEGTS